MDIQTAVLFLYLLFNAFTPAQVKLEKTLHTDDMPLAQRLNKRMELRNFIAEEKIRILGEEGEESGEEESGLDGLENPKYGPQSAGMSWNFGFDGTSAAEVLYKNSMDRVAYFQLGEEYFSAPEALDSDRHSIISVNDDSFVRTEYDKLYRILERTVWKNGKSSGACTMMTRTRYTYASDSATIPRFCGEEYLTENRYLETRYNWAGKPVEIVDYDVGKNAAGGATRLLKKKNNYTYDVSNRLVIDSQLENYDDGTSKTTKNIYSYTTRASVPDVSYYENGELRIQTSYKSEKDFTQTVFFDGGFKIVTEFHDGERISEITYIGDSEVSRRTF